ncbi:putative Tyr recombinase domain-containing protein [Pseudomonas marginalis]
MKTATTEIIRNNTNIFRVVANTGHDNLKSLLTLDLDTSLVEKPFERGRNKAQRCTQRQGNGACTGGCGGR